MLEGEPVDLRIARNGREAIALFPELAPDLVLMDVCMPEMDGFAATAAVRRLEVEHGLSRTPIIALTAYSGTEHHARCIEHDMDGYLTKPLNKPELVATVFGQGRGTSARTPDEAPADTPAETSGTVPGQVPGQDPGPGPVAGPGAGGGRGARRGALHLNGRVKPPAIPPSGGRAPHPCRSGPPVSCVVSLTSTRL